MRRVAPLLCLLAAACGEASPSLYVDLKSDFVPGVEVARAATSVWSDSRVVASDEHDLRGDDLLGGVRIAELTPLAPGDYTVEVRLVAPDGSLVLRRRVRVALQGTRVLTVVASRSCARVACPDDASPSTATECIGGQCVDPSCERAGPGCGPAECASASDCETLSACAEPRCVEGACFAAAIDGVCTTDQVCIPDRGCVSIEAPPDGGTDAGTDAGSPGVDAGPPPTCAGGCNDGNPCTSDTCVSGACTSAPASGGCDDGNACTYGDHCEGGGCAGTSYSCSAPPCMSASCDGSGGCSVGGGCGPGSLCDGSSCVACGGADQRCCDGGACSGGLWCYTGVCTCGQRGGPCCPWDSSCEPGASCQGGFCCIQYGGDCSSGGFCCDGVPCRSGLCFN